MNKNEIKWSCSLCTYENYQASSKCSVCLHPRGTEVIKLPPLNSEKPLIINDIESSSASKPYSDFIICPPSCSSKDDKTQSSASACSSVENHSLIDNNLLSTNTSVEPWSCTSCTFINSKNAARCSQCRSPKVSKNIDILIENSQSACFSKSDSDKANKWTCNICTYKNWNASKKCAVCLSERGAAGNSTSCEHSNDSILQDQNATPSSSNMHGAHDILPLGIHRKAASNHDSLNRISSASGLDNYLKSSDQRIVADNNTYRRATPRSPSLSSNSSHSSDDNRPQGSNQTRLSRQRHKKDSQVRCC